MVNYPSVTLQPTPVNASPQLSQQFVADDFDSLSHSKTAKRSWERNCLTSICQKPKKLYSTRASMIKSIRNQAIDSLYTTDVDGTSNFLTINYFKSANNNWFNQKQSTWSPFNDNPTRILLEAAHNTLTDHHCHLFLEYFMIMNKGSTILCLISKDHPLMKANSPQSDRIQNKMSQKKKNKVPISRCASDFLESWDDVAWCPVHFSTTTYFCA